jgi:hypothetical protein
MADAGTRSLQLGSLKGEFTSFMCLNDSCSLGLATIDGPATNNLATGAGTYYADLVVDFSPGGSCNIVDESAGFSFGSGTIFVHSHHEDCSTVGIRIDTTFQVTGGTGAFAGATGGGREFGALNGKMLTYSGSISY